MRLGCRGALVDRLNTAGFRFGHFPASQDQIQKPPTIASVNSPTSSIEFARGSNPHQLKEPTCKSSVQDWASLAISMSR
jgi:hypothetical protein